MNRFSLLLVCAALGLFSSRSFCTDLKTENDVKTALNGTWNVKWASNGMDKAKDEALKKMSVVIDGEKLTIKNGDQEEKFTIVSADPSKSPAWIDVHSEKENKTYPGLFEVKGDALVLEWETCSNRHGVSLGAADCTRHFKLERKK